MYRSPITIYDFSDIATQTEKMRKALQDNVEDYIMTEVTKTLGVEVDKEELIKALCYDRDQYEVGFREGYHARDEKIVRCKDCEYRDKNYGIRNFGSPFTNYIWCEKYNDFKKEDGFCSEGETE